MHVRIIKRLCVIILLSCESHNAVTVKKNLHGTNHRRNQNIYPEIVLVTVMKRRLFYVFLNDVLILRAVNLSRVKLVFLLLSGRIGVSLRCFNALFDLEVLIHVFSVFVALLVQSYAKVFHFAGDENASSLRA